MTAPEPNTWREVLSALDAKQERVSLDGRRVAVQEYGASNPDLLAGLEARGARRDARCPSISGRCPRTWGRSRPACRAIADGQIDVVLFTTATQVVHLLKVAGTMGIGTPCAAACENCVVASIGPTTSEEMREQGIESRPRTDPSEDGVSRARGGRAGGRDAAKPSAVERSDYLVRLSQSYPLASV